jgi:MFS transporter, AAHS family, 4-hydroxybenzoate transporter
MPIEQEMKQAQALDLRQLIDERPMSGFQLRVVLVCAAIAFMDGYDVQAMGYVAPALAASLQIARAALGPLISSGIVGMAVGALTFGPLADRFGRKPVLLTCTLIFGVMSLITATATSIQMIFVYRLLTGFGLGGALPNTIALTAEYTPKKYRATAITGMFCGFSIGAAVGGFVAAGLISRFGWQSVFVVGGIVPIVIAIVSALYLPESIRFLIIKGGRQHRVAAYLSKIAPGEYRGDPILAGDEEHASQGFSVKELFREGRATVTLLLWVCFFMNLLVLFFMNNWMPTVMNDAGIKIETAILITTLFQLAGTAGAIVLGRIFDRGHSFKVLALAYLGAAAAVLLVGEAGSSLAGLVFTVSLAGFCVVGGQTGSNALAAAFYPTAIRSTGTGWCLGIGRIGSIIGPILGGALLAAGGDVRRVFWVIAIPSVIAMAAAFRIAFITKRKGTSRG